MVRDFREQFPDVKLHLYQGYSGQIAEMRDADCIDFAIVTGGEAQLPGVGKLPAHRLHRRGQSSLHQTFAADLALPVTLPSLP